jgi:hypothetical protein
VEPQSVWPTSHSEITKIYSSFVQYSLSLHMLYTYIYTPFSKMVTLSIPFVLCSIGGQPYVFRSCYVARLMYAMLYLIRQKTVHNMSINPMLHVYIQFHNQQMLIVFKILSIYLFIYLFPVNLFYFYFNKTEVSSSIKL